MACIGIGSCLRWDTGEAMKMKGKWKRCTEEELLWFWYSWLPFFKGPNLMRKKKKKKKTTTKKPKQKTPNNHQEVSKICLPLPTSNSIYFTAVSTDTQYLAQPGTRGQGDIATWTFWTNQRFPQHTGSGGRHCQSVQKSFSRHSTTDKYTGKFFHPQELACDWQLMKDFVRITEGTCTPCGNLSLRVVLK